MKVQECGDGFTIEGDHLKLGKDAHALMIRRQIEFQKVVGLWDKRLKDYGTKTFCLPMTTLWHLDAAVQEIGEAWDIVEGGWKYHKTNPEPADVVELLMEVVDVHHYLINAYIFLGGQSEQQLVAAAVARSQEQLRLPEIGLQDVWDMGHRAYERGGERVDTLFGFGGRSHGSDWEKAVATRLNYLRHKIQEASSAIRTGVASTLPVLDRTKFPPASGYIFIELFPPLMGVYQAIPGVTPEVVYAAFLHKQAINFERQKGGY